MMNLEQQAELQELAGHLSERVKVMPRLSIGESRDTEPGAQPWTATLVGVKHENGKNFAVIETDAGNERLIETDLIRTSI